MHFNYVQNSFNKQKEVKNNHQNKKTKYINTYHSFYNY